MGRLVPEDFPLSTLANPAEQRVVESLRDGLTDGWLILPDIALRGQKHHLEAACHGNPPSRTTRGRAAGPGVGGEVGRARGGRGGARPQCKSLAACRCRLTPGVQLQRTLAGAARWVEVGRNTN